MFFRAIYFKYDNSSSAIHVSITTSDKFATRFLKESRKDYPSMTLVNAALHESAIWAAVAIDFSLPTLDLPKLSQTLLYGVISERIHFPDLASVIVSDKADKAYKDFFNELGRLFGLDYTEFDEELSATYSE